MTVTWTPTAKSLIGFMLKQDDFYLLLETGGKIIIEPQVGTNWTPTPKS